MDPNATAKQLIEALADADVSTAREHATNLADWICNGGFAVSVTIPASKMRAVCAVLASSLVDSDESRGEY